MLRAECAKHGRIRQMARIRFSRRTAPAVLILGILCCGLAYGGIAPNPGGAVVTTNSTSATIGYVDTPVTQRVDLYSTTVVALQNGSQVFSQSFSAPFSNAAVQAAIVQADGILSGRGATFGAPALTSNNSVLQSSVTAPPPTYTCLQAESIGTLTGVQTVAGTTTFGPATINVGDCQSDTFTVLVGQEDVNVNTDNGLAVARNVVTTNTFLTTQTYVITGTGGTAAVGAPALSGWGLAGLALLLAAAGTLLLQRRSSSRQSG
jgi:hypothetical protein